MGRLRDEVATTRADDWRSADGYRLDHVPVLDGVRGVAVLLVLLVHTRPQVLPGGMIGVDLFFVLSGFLITSILLRDFRDTGTVHIGRFYVKRALRLLPAMFVVVTACLLYSMATEAPEKLATTVGDTVSAILYYWNWRIVANFDHIQDHQRMIVHLWSLSVEEQFYIVWPSVVLGLVSSRLRPRSVLTLLGGAILLVYCLRIWMWHHYTGNPGYPVYFRTDTRADTLLCGAFVAFAAGAGMVPRGRLMRGVLQAMALIAIAVVGWHALRPMPWDDYVVYIQYTAVAVSCALIITTALWCPPTLLRIGLEWTPLRWIGRISYGIYLYHWPIFHRIEQDLDWSPLARTLWAFTLTLLIATISFYFLERPFLRMKDRMGRTRRPGASPTDVAVQHGVVRGDQRA